MKRWIYSLVFSLVTMLSVAQVQAYELPKPKVIAVFFSAEWCPACKQLAPALEAARKEGGFNTKDILFVKLDLTDKASVHQSILLSSALGIVPFVQKQGGSTGYVALLGEDKTTELARFDRTATAADIVAVIEKQLAANAAK